MSGWIAVDLDGTLAEYGGWKGPDHIGEPVPAMAFRVRQWLADGRDVRIFTARAGVPEQVPPIQAWCERHFGRALPVTAGPSEAFSPEQVQCAIRQWLDYGEQEFQKSQHGYFSGGGWAARCLRYHLKELMSAKVDLAPNDSVQGEPKANGAKPTNGAPTCNTARAR